MSESTAAEKTPGQIAYEAYKQTYTGGHPLFANTWVTQPQDLKAGFELAAAAVRQQDLARIADLAAEVTRLQRKILRESTCKTIKRLIIEKINCTASYGEREEFHDAIEDFETAYPQRQSNTK